MPISRVEIKKVKGLQNRKQRQSEGLYLAEGVRLLEEAYRNRILPKKIYYAPSLLSERAITLIEKFDRKGIDIKSGSASDLSRMGETETSQGILAVFKMPVTKLSELYKPDMRSILLCDAVADPGNIGTLWRSALAFGFSMMILTGESVDPFSPKVVRSSVGALFGLPVVVASREAVIDLLNKEKIKLIVTSVDNGIDSRVVIDKHKESKFILAVGSEAKGVDDLLLDKADNTIKINHKSEVESLNSAIAGSILMRECYERILQKESEN